MVGKKPIQSLSGGVSDGGVDTDDIHGKESRPLLEERVTKLIKRTRELFAANEGGEDGPAAYAPSQNLRISSKMMREYSNIPFVPVSKPVGLTTVMKPTEQSAKEESLNTILTGGSAFPSAPGVSIEPERSTSSEIGMIIDQIEHSKRSSASTPVVSTGIVQYQKREETSSAHFGSTALARRRPNQVPIPKWHAPWKLKRVISGHLGWVRAIAVDPSNDWFVTGSSDRSIKIWDLASGQLKLTLTGHINCIRGLAVSPRHPYLFSASEDKKVLCWDLEYNKVIRNYHGHLSGVYCMKLHPTLDVLVTGGRDSVARVWDMRSKQQVHCLSGHQNTVWSLETQATDPQIITGSMDCTIKLWDLVAGKAMTTLTHHKKAIRGLVVHPKEYTFMSGAADNLKKWHAKDGKFLQNYSGHNAIVNSLAVNQDDVLVSSADNGSMRFWDYSTGYCFQQMSTIPQPGSLDSETGIYASAFDMTGLRLITGEADKSIKIWQEDEEASEETHPIDMAAWTKTYTAYKRY